MCKNGTITAVTLGTMPTGTALSVVKSFEEPTTKDREERDNK